MTRPALLLLLLNVACDPATTPPEPEPQSSSEAEQPSESGTSGESGTASEAERPAPAPTAQPAPLAAPEPAAEADAEPVPELTAEAGAMPEPTSETEPPPRAEPTAPSAEAATPGPPPTCEAIEAEYSRQTSTDTCRSDADCHIVQGLCAVGLGGCNHAVSISVTQEALTTLGQAYSNAGCTGPVCRCATPPTSAHCESGSCQRGERSAEVPAPDPETPTRPGRPTDCPALACALPEMGPGEPICTRMALDENGCPTCRCAD